jgi:ABC-type branched-subunit amino acid transport system substrate-binding protein
MQRLAQNHRVDRCHVLAVLLAVAGLLPGGALAAENIKVGMSTALDGPASALGQGVKLGVEAYFDKINEAGGVGGRKLELVALDDGYEPERAAPNMRNLIDQGVVAVIGNVGTPTAIVTVPIANERKTLLFGAFTGAGVLRKNPPERYVINYRASYAEETAAMIDGLLGAGIKPEEIAFFTQNDGYGDAGYKGAVEALQAAGYAGADKLSHGRYERNTLNVEDGLGTILDAPVEPKAIIMVGAYAPCAQFIKLAKQDFPDTLFLNVSFVGSNALKKELGEEGDGVIVTQVVPHFAANLAGVGDYRKDLKAFKVDAEPGFVSLEGYLAARIFVEALRSVKGQIDRESVIDALESLQGLDLGIGVQVAYSATEHQASHKVWPTVIDGGSFVPLDWTAVKVARN